MSGLGGVRRDGADSRSDGLGHDGGSCGVGGDGCSVRGNSRSGVGLSYDGSGSVGGELTTVRGVGRVGRDGRDGRADGLGHHSGSGDCVRAVRQRSSSIETAGTGHTHGAKSDDQLEINI